MPKELWGVNSAAHVSKNLYHDVVGNFGNPRYWGRSLSNVANVADGLSEEEINFLHRNGVKIIPIYYDVSATGYRSGRVAAANAVFHAKRLGYPKEKLIFANIEKDSNIDETWISGWVDAIFRSGFRAGICVDTSKTSFHEAYSKAASNNKEISNQLVIWSKEPTTGTTSKEDAPAYSPTAPPSLANVWAWRYGENSEDCPIDTNLIGSKLYEQLW